MQSTLRNQPATFWAAAGGVVAMLIGMIGPWMKIVEAGVPGVDDKGAYVMAAAALAAVFLWQFTRDGGREFALASLAMGVMAVAVCAWGLYDVSSEPHLQLRGEEIDVIRPGWGLWTSALGSLMLTAASYLMYRDPAY